MSVRGLLRVAAAQTTPSYLDREATLLQAADQVRSLAQTGVDLVVFSESFAPGYPDWVWRTKPYSDEEWYARFADQAVEVEGPHLDPVREAAREGGPG